MYGHRTNLGKQVQYFVSDTIALEIITSGNGSWKFYLEFEGFVFIPLHNHFIIYAR